jgi:regulatory protein
VERAREACLSLLDYRARSRGELRDRLRRKGFDQRVIDTALAELEAAGLVDDEGFARAWVQERLARSPRGSLKMRWELRGKGVEEELIQRALAEEMGHERELEAALSVASRYAPRPGEDDTARSRRLAQALKRRGFTFDVIETVLARVRGADNDGPA